ncbi:outer membrane assembly protein AsmA [Gilliamella apicola]|uniref:Outer membrane assembly protein AsmA n=1 Tax=Gilliamella apicola TaxID=1196095 RepID=A0A242NLD8_9GAMM|nr:outer membrane assembly protein AsmA [Gilliamella apicola]OTP83281.1 outer membrane assembly protein AsmA [Gilliamella apicola]OTP86565.1 outer membrane assembly protein AsmA [Gilliamella apicola]OTP90944.1 outer membrane assembly protein AsmA [Gilliamella apicola]OTQ00840.1 outer membrane assembly protein AsmA [Gilliamella apicola]OTQ11052.1 outer membrane assembly protein AsmA [Gilliamella apicola]
MIKKILVTLLILILLTAIGIVSLIVFVDPNNYRGFISDTVKDKTGYELTIDGNLRWHIWPQISILTDSVKLSDIDAKKPILTADNMRLDVELFPLFSKKLEVKNVFIKSAIINITDDSKGQVYKHKAEQLPSTDESQTTQTKQQKDSSKWAFTLNKLEVSDSTIVLQNKDDFINFRNINLAIIQKADKKITIDVKGNIDRNQQNFSYVADADVDLTLFPEKAIIDLKKFDYTYKGIALPTKELKGNLKGVINYQHNSKQLTSKDLSFSVNENYFSGAFNANFDKKPYIDLTVTSNELNLTPFLEKDKKTNENITIQQTPPVVSNVTKVDNELNFLNSFNAKAKLDIKKLNINKMILNNIDVALTNNDGVATFQNISFDFAKGHIAATGMANGKHKYTQIKLIPKVTNIDLNTFFNQMETPNDLEGLFNASGDIEVNTLSGNKLLESLKGNLSINVTNAKLNKININNIIQNAATKYTKDISSTENMKNYTEFSKISTDAYLNKGNLELTTLNALSPTLEVIDGSGRVGMTQKDLDINMNIKILGGWNGKSNTIAKLQKLVIPLRIYGQFSKLHYQLDIGQVIKDLFNDKLQESLDKFRIKLENRNSKDDSKSKSKQKAVDMLENLLSK